MRLTGTSQFKYLFINSIVLVQLSRLKLDLKFGSSSVQEPVTFTSDVEQRKQRSQNNK